MQTAVFKNKDAPHLATSAGERPAWWHGLILTACYIALHGAIAWSVPQFEPATHNDDWVYVPPAQQFYETGEFQPHAIAAALALPQIVAGGGLFHLAGGFRYGLLRDSMVVFGVLPIWLMWILLRQLGLPRGQASLGAILMMTNPLLVSLTWSFQTEIPFLTFALAGLFFLLLGEEPEGKTWALLPACVAFLLMSLTRQTGLCVVAAAMVFLLFRRRWTAALSVGILIPLTLGFERSLTASPNLIYLPYAKQALFAQLRAFSPTSLFLLLYEGLHLVGFLGVFLMPVFLAGRPVPLKRGLFCACGLVMAGVFVLDANTGLTPLLGPYLKLDPAYTLGPVTLEVTGAPTPEKTHSSPFALLMFRVLAGIGGTVLLTRMTMSLIALPRLLFPAKNDSPAADTISPEEESFSSDIEPRQVLVALVLWASLAGVLLTSVVIGRRPFDQYLILALPLSMALVWPRMFWKPSAISAVMLLSSIAVLGIAGALGTVDYWRWNAARWEAVRKLELAGVGYRNIDGGYAYNGLHANLNLPAAILEFHRKRGSTIPKDWATNQTPPSGPIFSVGPTPPTSVQTLVIDIPYSTPLSQTPRHMYVKRSVIDAKRKSPAANVKSTPQARKEP